MTLEEMAQAYHQQASESKEAIDFYSDRGINQTVFEKHLLGWIEEPVNSNHDRWQGMPVVPYLAARGEVVTALRANPFVAESAGRFDMGYIEHDFPLTRPKLRLYNVGNALPGLRTSRVHMVEKVIDVLTLRSEGERAVGVPGFQNFHPWWAELFMHSEVVVDHDGSKPDDVAFITRLLRQRRITFTEHLEKQPTVVEEG